MTTLRPVFIAQGWIAVALVIFGQWKPGRTMFGAYMVAFIFRLSLDLQGKDALLGLPNIFYEYQPSTFFLEMLPYVMVILVLVFAGYPLLNPGRQLPVVGSDNFILQHDRRDGRV